MTTIMIPEIDLNSTERFQNYAPYVVKSNGVMVATVFGPMAAVAAEAICKAMEDGTLPPNDALFNRHRMQAAEKSDVRVLTWGWNSEESAVFDTREAAMEHFSTELKSNNLVQKVYLCAADKTILELLKA